jgi:chromosome partitioning protein
VGKTTLATHIAGELALRGQNVILLDADPQGSALDWTQRRSQQGLPRLFSAVSLARETLHQVFPELARRAYDVIIDGPLPAPRCWRRIECRQCSRVPTA